MAYSILHLSRNNQRTHLIVDDVTTLPVMFATIYGMNELSKKHLGTQENILCSLRFFYVYYFKKHKRTFDYDFYRPVYNISCFIRELDVYNSLLSESLILAQDYGIRARMNGVLEPAIEQLRALGGWSLTSKVPLRYAKRFIEVVRVMLMG